MDQATIKSQLEQATSQIKTYSTLMRPFFELEQPLKEYSASLKHFATDPVYLKRQELLKTVIRKKLEKIFGPQFQQELRVDLDGPLAINIADHHQVLNHPILISSNVISDAEKFFQPNKQAATIVISSGDVPPNNYFSLKGFTFHGKRVPIFRNTEREYSSYYLPKRDFDFIEKLHAANRWEEFTLDEQTFLQDEYKKISAMDFSRCEDYADQITMIVRETWPRMFEQSIRSTLPELLYLTQEETVTNCLIELLSTDNMISQTILDPSMRERVLENFRGIVVTWNEQEQKGTHFFWKKYPGQPRSLRMYIEGDRLVPTDPRFRDQTVLLERDTLIDLLQKREIYPSLFTIFGVLNFYMGVRPLVGHGSIHYLAFMREAWEKTLRQVGMDEEAERAKIVDTNGYMAGISLFFKRVEAELVAQYAYDLFYDGGVRKEYLQRMFETPFKDITTASVPGIYDYVAAKYFPTERMKQLPTIGQAASLIFDWIH